MLHSAQKMQHTHNSQDLEREWWALLHVLNNPPCVKKFQKFCLISFLKGTTTEKFLIPEKLQEQLECFACSYLGEVPVLLWSFPQVSFKWAIFFKTSWYNFQEVWPPLNKIVSLKPSYSKAGNMIFFSRDKDGNGNSFINNRYFCKEL